jgi:hypothetical protein
MSHIVEIQTRVRDAAAAVAACRRLQWPHPREGVHRLFSGEETGLGIHLPDWWYPVVCDLATGTLKYDHFEGRWGDPRFLDRFLQIYAVEPATLVSRRQGNAVTEQSLPDGSIRLSIQVAGE